MTNRTKPATLYTIGFTQKRAEEFFTLLQENQIRKVIDVRLNNRSQLAGFSKGRDLEYFLRTIGKIDYEHHPELAPSKEILNRYKKEKGSWEEYEHSFLQLLNSRRVDVFIHSNDLDHCCLLCSEPTAEQCHRRLVAEEICRHQSGSKIIISHI